MCNGTAKCNWGKLLLLIILKTQVQGFSSDTHFRWYSPTNKINQVKRNILPTRNIHIAVQYNELYSRFYQPFANEAMDIKVHTVMLIPIWNGSCHGTFWWLSMKGGRLRNGFKQRLIFRGSWHDISWVFLALPVILFIHISYILIYVWYMCVIFVWRQHMILLYGGDIWHVSVHWHKGKY